MVRFWKFLLIWCLLKLFHCKARWGGVYSPAHIIPFQTSSAVCISYWSGGLICHLPLASVSVVVCNFHNKSYWQDNHPGDCLCAPSIMSRWRSKYPLELQHSEGVDSPPRSLSSYWYAHIYQVTHWQRRSHWGPSLRIWSIPPRRRFKTRMASPAQWIQNDQWHLFFIRKKLELTGIYNLSPSQASSGRVWLVRGWIA